MKISFDMTSFSSATVASSSSSSASSATSVRDTIISYARAILPSLPASFYDFVPFTLAAIMALLFTALLVLLVEDSDDLGQNSSRQHNSSSSASLKSSSRSSKRLVGLAERDKDAESGDDNGNDWDASPWDPRADLDPSSRRNLRQSQNWMAIQNEKIATSHGYRTTNKRLLASPPSSASPQSPAFTPPMLSMAKMIMHRHDQSTKRSRSSKTTSLPPSPPPAGTTTSFGSMQYTLKSATIRNEKLAIVAFPTAEFTEQPSPPQRSSSDDTGKGTSSTKQAPPLHTRHARNRSVALPSISLSYLNSIPSLVPTLPLLQSKSSQDRSVRRSPSSLLEEGGSSNESLPTHSRKSSSERVPSISEDMEAIKNSSERRPSEAIVELEKGHATPR